jgi:hypothetical protein
MAPKAFVPEAQLEISRVRKCLVNSAGIIRPEWTAEALAFLRGTFPSSRQDDEPIDRNQALACVANIHGRSATKTV